MFKTFPTRPRQYAAEIIAEPRRERRKAMLEHAPADFRPLIEAHVRNYWALKQQ